jgi:hypothetical protein
MRAITAELWPPQEHAPYGEGIYIGVRGEPHVTGLAEDELVLLQDIDVQVVVRVHKVRYEGREVWFGAFQEEIQDRPVTQETIKGHS